LSSHWLPMFFRERDPQPFEPFGVTGEPAFNDFVLSLDEYLALDEWRGRRLSSLLIFLHHLRGETPGMLISVESVLRPGFMLINKAAEFFAVLFESRRMMLDGRIGCLPAYREAIIPAFGASLIGGPVAASASAPVNVQIRNSAIRFYAFIKDVEPE